MTERTKLIPPALGIALGLAAALVTPSATRAQGLSRQTDKDVKAIIEEVNQARDRFEDQLDGDLKRATLRGPRGEVNVERYLDDLQDNVGKLKDRFTPNYAASAEVDTVLQQGSAIHGFMTSRPASLKGRSEWDRMAAGLGRLATAYSTSFPATAGAAVRRINDGEAAGAAATAAAELDRFKNEIGKDKALAKADKDVLRQEADGAKRIAKTLESRIKDGKPATAEAQQLFEATTRLASLASGKQISAGAMAPWGTARGAVVKLEQAFGKPVAP